MPLEMDGVNYLPVLDLKPAEMLALQELPEKDKDAMLPLFLLRPWVGAARLESALSRIRLAFGTRRAFLEVADLGVLDLEKIREVHGELGALRNSKDGYLKWREFLEQEANQHFIPVLQVTDPAQFGEQARLLHALGRGVALRLEVVSEQVVIGISAALSVLTAKGTDVVVILDYCKQGPRFSLKVQEVSALVSSVLQHLPFARICISASSFPMAFVDVSSQSIFERTLFAGVKKHHPGIVYSDRGSARAERQKGGGGVPAPRIDFAKRNEWVFFREDSATKGIVAYKKQALRLMESEHWDKDLKLWGCQMIQKTALGDSSGIISPSRSTAARINIHLHQQLYFNNPSKLYDTDEEWIDI